MDDGRDDGRDDGMDDGMDGWMEKAARCPLLYKMVHIQAKLQHTNQPFLANHPALGLGSCTPAC